MDISAECRACHVELDHCHGTLLIHPDGDVECTDPVCVDPDPVRHEFQIDCQAIAGGCDCDETAIVLRVVA